MPAEGGKVLPKLVAGARKDLQVTCGDRPGGGGYRRTYAASSMCGIRAHELILLKTDVARFSQNWSEEKKCRQAYKVN